MRTFTTILLLSLVLVAVGCNTTVIAERALDRSLQVQADIATQSDEALRLMTRLWQTETRAKQFAETELALYKKAMASGSTTVSLEDVSKALAELQQRENTTGYKRDNFRDDVAFLQAQNERLRAYLASVLSIYIQGQKSIFEVIAERLSQKKSTAATQPVSEQTILPNKDHD